MKGKLEGASEAVETMKEWLRTEGSPQSRLLALNLIIQVPLEFFSVRHTCGMPSIDLFYLALIFSPKQILE